MKTYEISVVLPAAGILRADDRNDNQSAMYWARKLSEQPGVKHVVVTEVLRSVAGAFRNGEVLRGDWHEPVEKAPKP